MFNLLGIRKKNDCSRVLDALENSAEGTSALSASQREHLAACTECRDAADAFLVSRNLLQELSAHGAEPGPWFTPRVMAAIAAREAELRQSLDTWVAVPRLAQRLTWVSALALLLASSWLYESPKHAQTSAANQGQGAIESLFDSTQSSAPDDVVLPMESGHD